MFVKAAFFWNIAIQPVVITYELIHVRALSPRANHFYKGHLMVGHIFTTKLRHQQHVWITWSFFRWLRFAHLSPGEGVRLIMDRCYFKKGNVSIIHLSCSCIYHYRWGFVITAKQQVIIDTNRPRSLMVHLRRENAEISTYAMWIVKFDPCTSKRVAMEFGKSCIIWRLSCIMVLYTSFWPVTLAEVNSAAGVISQSVTTGTQDVDNRLLIFGAGYDNRTNEGSTSQLPEQTMPSEPSAPTAHDELMTSTIPTVPWIAVSTQSQTHTTHSQQETTQIPGEFNFLFFDNDLSRGLPAPVANRTALYLMGLVTVEIGSAGWSSAGVVPALQMAMRDVNARQDLLPGYELRLHMKDTKVSHTNMTESFFISLVLFLGEFAGYRWILITKSHYCRALVFSVFWISCLTNSRVAGDLKRHSVHVTSLLWSVQYKCLRLSCKCHPKRQFPTKANFDIWSPFY